MEYVCQQDTSGWKVLIVDDLHPIFMERLASAGVAYTYRPDIQLPEILSLLPDYEVLIVRSKIRMTKELLDIGKKLRCIGRSGAGMDNIDEVAAEAAGIQLLNAPEGNRDAVGEHVTGMLLSMMNHLRRSDREVRTGLWRREENRGVELGGKTVGLIGYGHNGRATARKLSGFDVRVLAYDKYKHDFSDSYVEEASLERLFEETDVLSLHIPLTVETRQMINEGFLMRFRKPIFFVNAARGEIVEVPAVLKGLEERRILGAAFDVLPVEKFPSLSEAAWYRALIDRDDVLLSPHIGGWTFESYYKLSDVLVKKLLSFMGLSPH